MSRTWSMDSTDMKILSILQDDSRKSFVELAEELGLSETAVRNRVSRLIEKGVIKRFTIQLDLDKIGKPISSIVCVRIGGEIGPIAASGLMDIEAITEIYTVTGEYDLILKILCKSIEDLERVVEKIRALDFTKETNTFVILHKVKDGNVIT
jgi:DNA-binding Lrp family transcriptional regulator